jgi:hypothetical protein
MKSTAAKSIHLLLALFILAAALAPVCTAAQNCSMPCCRHKAQPASHPADMAAGRSCCTQASDDSADNLSGCRFVKTSAALPSGAESVPGAAAAVGTVGFNNPIERRSHAPLTGSIHSRQPGPPLYLRHQTLLI